MANNVKRFYDIAEDDNIQETNQSEQEFSYDDEQEDNYDVTDNEEEYELSEQEQYEYTDESMKTSLKVVMIITYCIMLAFAFFGIYCLFKVIVG